ncbi:MAG TPA: DUF2997 domain-containing protein [Candidatus Ozemobacteraceae bacterium]|nr:DUF2997 domain-containing protein [Candidatus Ozemobacteraceae bacterium]
MTKKEEITVTIKPDGQVEMHLEGFGKACDDVAKELQQLLNARVEKKQFTSEYYSATVKTQNTVKSK